MVNHPITYDARSRLLWLTAVALAVATAAAAVVGLARLHYHEAWLLLIPAAGGLYLARRRAVFEAWANIPGAWSRSPSGWWRALEAAAFAAVWAGFAIALRHWAHPDVATLVLSCAGGAMAVWAGSQVLRQTATAGAAFTAALVMANLGGSSAHMFIGAVFAAVTWMLVFACRGLTRR